MYKLFIQARENSALWVRIIFTNGHNFESRSVISISTLVIGQKTPKIHVEFYGGVLEKPVDSIESIEVNSDNWYLGYNK